MSQANNKKEMLNAVAFSDYKSIKSHTGLISIDMNSNISLVIGRNNSGKSSFIDVIEKALCPQMDISVGGLSYCVKLDEDHIARGFSKNISGGDIPGNHYAYGKSFIGQNIYIEYSGSRLSMSGYQNPNMVYVKKITEWNSVAQSYALDVSNYSFLRINADRDISPESEADSESVEKNGTGATNIIRKYLNYDKYDESVVEQVLLRELNKIMNPDAHFSGLRIQQIDTPSGDLDTNKKWEIFLQEDGKRYALSKSGSGLKTIILILINLYILPRNNRNSRKNKVFAFEEVENNLHPALQRRLFEYLYDYATRENIRIFLTTHSHVAINAYYGKPGVSLYHITKNDGVSSVIKINNDENMMNILDDLDVKASDLFQANGIIWVEGPSDRIYIKRWLEVFCENDITEGIDYQFAYYGGRLLAHYTSNEKESKNDGLINILKTNRHVAIVIDSDKKIKGGHINDTKRRIRDEFKSMGSFCWITEGREIENYLSVDAVNQVHNKSLNQIGQYESFPEYIRNCDASFANHKVDSARKYAQFITEENSYDVLDLKDKVLNLYGQIKKW